MRVSCEPLALSGVPVRGARRRAVIAAVIIAYLSLSGCGANPVVAPVVVASLATQPFPVSYISLPGKGGPGQSMPPCCRGIYSGFTAVVAATGEAHLMTLSLRVTRSDGEAYTETLDSAGIIRLTGTDAVRKDVPLPVPIQLVASFAVPRQTAQYVLRIEATLAGTDGSAISAAMETAMVYP